MAAAARDAALARLRLRHLQCALAVARAGTLRGAAEALAVSQPAVTKTLNELEALLGVRLFERGRRGAVATPEAEAFLRHAGSSVDALAQAVDAVLGAAAEPVLRVGALPTLAPSLLPRALQALRERRPGARVQVATGRNHELLALLRRRELDLVVGRLAEPEAMVGLTFELLYAEPLAVVVRRGHALTRGAATPAALAGWPRVLPPAGTLIRHAADSLFAGHGAASSAGLTETLSSSLARALVLDDDAVWITPPSAAEPDLADGRLVRLPLATAGSEEPVGLLLAADTAPAAALRPLVEALRREAAQRRARAQAGPQPRRRRAAKAKAAKPKAIKA